MYMLALPDTRRVSKASSFLSAASRIFLPNVPLSEWLVRQYSRGEQYSAQKHKDRESELVLSLFFLFHCLFAVTSLHFYCLFTNRSRVCSHCEQHKNRTVHHVIPTSPTYHTSAVICTITVLRRCF
ncbi:unnamed protein product [Ixodes persulcatus]